MSLPVNRMGDETGWTTVAYFSKHEDERREIWRHQWGSRLRTEQDKYNRYQDRLRTISVDRERRRREHDDDMHDRIERDKWRSKIPYNRRMQKQQLSRPHLIFYPLISRLQAYNDELESVETEKHNDSKAAKELARIRFLKLEAELREKRRQEREEARKAMSSGATDYLRGGTSSYTRSNHRQIELDRLMSGVERRRNEREQRQRDRQQNTSRPAWEQYDDYEKERRERRERSENMYQLKRQKEKEIERQEKKVEDPGESDDSGTSELRQVIQSSSSDDNRQEAERTESEIVSEKNAESSMEGDGDAQSALLDADEPVETVTADPASSGSGQSKNRETPVPSQQLSQAVSASDADSAPIVLDEASVVMEADKTVDEAVEQGESGEIAALTADGDADGAADGAADRDADGAADRDADGDADGDAEDTSTAQSPVLDESKEIGNVSDAPAPTSSQRSQKEAAVEGVLENEPQMQVEKETEKTVIVAEMNETEPETKTEAEVTGTQTASPNPEVSTEILENVENPPSQGGDAEEEAVPKTGDDTETETQTASYIVDEEQIEVPVASSESENDSTNPVESESVSLSSSANAGSDVLPSPDGEENTAPAQQSPLAKEGVSSDKKVCALCGKELNKKNASKAQFKKAVGSGKCSACIASSS